MTTDGAATYEAALTAAEQELASVTTRLHALDEQRDKLVAQQNRLKLAVQVLADLVPAAPAQGALELQLGTVPPLPQPPNMRRGIAETSSVYRVGLILRDKQRPMHVTDLVEEFESRGWVEPAWVSDAVRGNVHQAARRAVQAGWATPVPDRASTYVTTQAPVDTPSAENDRDGEDE